MSHGVAYAGWNSPVAERVITRRYKAATLISTLGRLLDIWVTPKELQWEAEYDTPSYLHRGVTLRHASMILGEGGATVEYLEGLLPCKCGGHIRSGYMCDEGHVSALLEGRDPIAVRSHHCTSEVIRNLGDSCPTCAHPLYPIGPSYTSCHYCGFHLAVEDDGSVVRENGMGVYLIRLHHDEYAGTAGRFESREERDRWTSEVRAAGWTVARAYYTHQSDGAWKTVYLVGGPEEYDWLSPTTHVPGPEEEPVAWPA